MFSSSLIVRTAAFLVLSTSIFASSADNPKTVTISKKGKHWTAKVQYPHFVHPSPVQKFAEAKLEKEAKLELKDFIKGTKDLRRHPKDYPYGMELSMDFTVTFNSANLVSGYTEEYSDIQGGLHGDLGAETWIFAIKNGKPAELKRKDIFLPHTDFRKIAQTSLRPRIEKRVKGENVLLNDMKYADMKSVCIEPKGIEWVFGAYQVAPYSEGNVAITVPWDELHSSLNWNGPLKPLKGQILKKR